MLDLFIIFLSIGMIFVLDFAMKLKKRLDNEREFYNQLSQVCDCVDRYIADKEKLGV